MWKQKKPLDSPPDWLAGYHVMLMDLQVWTSSASHWLRPMRYWVYLESHQKVGWDQLTSGNMAKESPQISPVCRCIDFSQQDLRQNQGTLEKAITVFSKARQWNPETTARSDGRLTLLWIHSPKGSDPATFDEGISPGPSKTGTTTWIQRLEHGPLGCDLLEVDLISLMKRDHGQLFMCCPVYSSSTCVNVCFFSYFSIGILRWGLNDDMIWHDITQYLT